MSYFSFHQITFEKKTENKRTNTTEEKKNNSTLKLKVEKWKEYNKLKKEREKI